MDRDAAPPRSGALTPPVEGRPRVDQRPRAAGLLEDQRRDALARVEELTAELASVANRAVTEGRDDEHDPDGATAAFEQSMATGLLATARQRLLDVDLARDRLADDSYGRCQWCGEMIADERLAAMPATATCRACAAMPRRRPMG